jgi:uncharacterized membrane protein YdjX (TVP38/TMEM64 family)
MGYEIPGTAAGRAVLVGATMNDGGRGRRVIKEFPSSGRKRIMNQTSAASGFAEAPTRGRALLRLGILAATLLGAWWIARSLGLLEYVSLARIGELIRAAREAPWAAPAFVAIYAVVAAFGLPGTPLTLAGGAIFGALAGTGLNWLGAMLGSTGAFLIAKFVGGNAIRSLLGRHGAKLDKLSGEHAFTGLLRLRLIPVVPFNVLNFGAGLAGMKLRDYVAATALGILPGTAVYTYFADALIAGVDGARQAAFVRVAVAGALLVALSFAPALARRLGWISAALFLSMAVPTRATAQIVDHGPFSRLLAAYVQDGLVDYGAFARDSTFATYLRSLDRADPAGLPMADRLAYWINVYNAYTIELINVRGEKRSIRNINKRFGVSFKSPWAEPIVRAGGRVLTLDDVEHKIIRPDFRDARIHAALVCAALGCPPLRSEAFVAERLDEQLDEQARRFLMQTTKNRVDVANRTVHGSPIFTWYREDFGGTLAGVGAFWARYFPPGAARELLLSGDFRYVETKYDWTLNVRR